MIKISLECDHCLSTLCATEFEESAFEAFQALGLQGPLLESDGQKAYTQIEKLHLALLNYSFSTRISTELLEQLLELSHDWEKYLQGTIRTEFKR